jgi:hypothetical protein
MNDQDPATDAPAAKPAKKSAKPAEDTRTAKIRALDTIKARGFTLGKGSIVDRVPLAHAEFLASKGKAEILEVA